MHTVRRTWLAAGLVGLVAAALLAGCSAGAGDASGADASSDQAEPNFEGSGESGSGRETADRGGPGGEAGGVLIDPRAIIYTGVITVQVADVDRAATEATALATRYGGYVGGDRRTADDAGAQASLVLRIPSDDFADAVAALAALGEEIERQVDTEDVTEELVDLRTRIATVQASVDRTRELMEQAESISDVVEIEEQLTEREGTLASLQARERELGDLAALSTVTLHLIEGQAADPAGAEEERDVGFLTGLRAGWDAFAATMSVLVTVVGALLPWLVAAAVPVTGLLWWRRHRILGRT